MIRNLKLKKHKGIREGLEIKDIGHINVICGKNSSGKSSVLECISNPDLSKIGTMVDAILPLLMERIDAIAKGFSTPTPQSIRMATEKWFKKLQDTNSIIYDGEPSPEQSHLWNREMMQPYGSYGQLVNFTDLFRLTIVSLKQAAILIPPKRTLDIRAQIAAMDMAVESNGKWLLNRLFYLKNQDKHSEDNAVFERIYEAFHKVTGGYYFHIPPTSHNEIHIQFSNDGQHWIDGDSCGLGLCDVLIILSHVLDGKSKLILIEEPESHIHPDTQRRLLEFIKSQKDKQFFLSTHSNVFLDTSYIDKVIYVEMTGEGVKISDETSRAAVLENLGYSTVDNLTADLVIITEGPNDRPILREIFSKIGVTHVLKYHFLFGNVMEHHDVSLVLEKNKAMAIIDRDPKSNESRKAFQSICQKSGVPCHRLKKYAIENYFSLKAIKEEFPHQTFDPELKELDPDTSVKDQLGFDVKRRGGQIIKRMTLGELENTDLLSFCREVEKALKQHCSLTPSP